MIDASLHGFESVFGWLIEASWQASVLVVLVLLLHLVLRRRLNPRWHHALWLLVIARLLLPFLPESALSLFQFAPSPPPGVIATVTEPIFQPSAQPLEATTVVQASSVAYPFSSFTFLALGWFVGVMVLCVLTWQVNRRFARHVAAAPLITDPRLLQLSEAAQRELGLHRRLRLIESAQVQSPAIMGLFRPTLILPQDVRTRFDDEELRFIFLHEFAHLKRGDLILQWLVALLQILHWFNPVLWYAFRRMRADREPATDALVLSCTGEASKESYGQVLVKLLEHYHQRHSLPTLVGILEDKDQFKRRFSLIARFTRGAYGWSFFAVLLLVVLATVCLTKSKAAVERPISKVSGTEIAPMAVWSPSKMKAIEDSHTPLMKALEQRHYDEARVLLSKGVDVNTEDKLDNTALGFLMEDSTGENRFPLDILQVLLERGRNPNPIVHLEFSSPIQSDPVLDVTVMDAEFSTEPDRLADFRRAAQTLLEHGATFATTKGDEQALLQASVRGDLSTVRQLIAKGVSINAADDNGWTPLMLSIAFDRTEITNWLLARGANVNVPSRRGAEDPLTWAADRGNDDLVEKLIARGAKANLAWRGLARSVERNDQRMFGDLIKAGADPKQFARAFVSDSNDEPRLRQIASEPLYTTIKKGQTSMAFILLDKGVDPEPANVEEGKNYAYWAVYYDRPQILQSLLDHGANPLAKDDAGETPLSLAQKSHPNLVPMLQAAIAKSKNSASIVPAQMSGTNNGVSQLQVGQIYKDFQSPFYQGGKLKFALTASEAKGITLNRAETTDLKIDLYDNDMATTTITSPRADFYLADRKMRTHNTVRIDCTNLTARSQFCDFDLAAERYTLRNDVKVTIKQFDLVKSVSKTGEAASSSAIIQSDELHMDQVTHVAVFTGNATVTGTNFTMKCQEMTVNFDQAGKLDTIVFKGDVEVVQCGRVVHSGQAIYYYGEDKFDFTDQPILIDGGKKVSAPEIIIKMSSPKIFIPHGQPQIFILPATVHPESNAI